VSLSGAKSYWAAINGVPCGLRGKVYSKSEIRLYGENWRKALVTSLTELGGTDLVAYDAWIKEKTT